MSDDVEKRLISIQREIISSLKDTIEKQEALLATLREVNGHLKNEVALQEKVIGEYKTMVDEYRRMDPFFGIGAREFRRD